MSYEKQNWEDLPSEETPISAARLLHMENGIFNAPHPADGASIQVGDLLRVQSLNPLRIEPLSSNTYAPLGHVTATTSVHGIADTAQLETKAGATEKANTRVTEHENTGNPHNQYAHLEGATFTGVVTYTNTVVHDGREVRRPLIEGARETSINMGASGFTLDCSLTTATRNYIYCTGTEARTISISNVPGTDDSRATTFVLYFTTNPTVTWSGAAFKFVNGLTPSWTGAAIITVTVMRGAAVVSDPSMLQ